MFLEKTQSYIKQQIIEKSIKSDELAHQLVLEIAQFLKPGVSESEAEQFAHQCFAEHGVNQLWHPPHIRFGEHTLLSFREKTEQDYTLQENDIAFIDIGIVWDGVEGDRGATVVVGENSLFQGLKIASERLFEEAINYWKAAQPTGQELYNFIYQKTEALGYRFNLDPVGHLIGAYPHSGMWRGGLNKYPSVVEPGAWILEIQIRHPTEPYGAFYEGLLV